MNLWAPQGDDLDSLAGARVILSLSGGKDSTACALWLERNGIEFQAVFMDTGWEHPATLDYIRGPLTDRFGAVTEISSSRYPGGFVGLVREKGIFPQRQRRFCTEKLKTIPFFEFVDSIERDMPLVVVLGIRAEESASRAKAERWSRDDKHDLDTFRPLIGHSFDGVIQMHHEGNIAPNPLYLQGAKRVGCFPCLFAVKKEVALVARLYPERVTEIERLEVELTEARQSRLSEDPQFRDTVELGARRFVAMRHFRADGGEMPADEFRSLFKSCVDTDSSPARFVDPAPGPREHQDYLALLDKTAADLLFQKVVESIRYAYSPDGDLATAAEMRKPVTYFGGREPTNPRTIREIVEWSRTTHGGRQLALFDSTASDGCTRWGLCDSPGARLTAIEEPK